MTDMTEWQQTIMHEHAHSLNKVKYTNEWLTRSRAAAKMEASGIVPGSQQFRRNWKRFIPWRIAPRFTTFFDFPPSWLEVKWSSKLWQPEEVKEYRGDCREGQGKGNRHSHQLKKKKKKWCKNPDEYSFSLNSFLALMCYLEDNMGIFKTFVTSVK